MQESFLPIESRRSHWHLRQIVKKSDSELRDTTSELSNGRVSCHRGPDRIVTECELIDGSNLVETNRLATVEGGASRNAPAGPRRSLQTLTPELRRTEVVSSTTIPPPCQPAFDPLAPYPLAKSPGTVLRFLLNAVVQVRSLMHSTAWMTAALIALASSELIFAFGALSSASTL